MTTENSDSETASRDAPDEMTEQIEATFGPAGVYVSGTDADRIEETFENVWETVMETYEKVHEMSDIDDSDDPSRTFGD